MIPYSKGRRYLGFRVKGLGRIFNIHPTYFLKLQRSNQRLLDTELKQNPDTESATRNPMLVSGFLKVQEHRGFQFTPKVSKSLDLGIGPRS